MARAPPGRGPAPRTSIRPAPPASPVGIREAEQRGRSAERGSERMLCAPCAAQSRVSRAARARSAPARSAPAAHAGAGGRIAAWAATRPPRSFGGHLFRPWTFQLYVGVEGGGCTGAGDRRAPDSHAAHTDGAASTTNAPFLCHISTSFQPSSLHGRVDIPTGVYKRQATSPFKPPPSRAVRALRAPPWPPPWPRPWPRPPPPPPLQP